MNMKEQFRQKILKARQNRMRSNIIFASIYLVVILTFVYCYFANIYQLTKFTEFSGLLVIKAIGIVAVPIGILMGALGLF